MAEEEEWPGFSEGSWVMEAIALRISKRSASPLLTMSLRTILHVSQSRLQPSSRIVFTFSTPSDEDALSPRHRLPIPSAYRFQILVLERVQMSGDGGLLL